MEKKEIVPVKLIEAVLHIFFFLLLSSCSSCEVHVNDKNRPYFILFYPILFYFIALIIVTS